MRKSNIGSVCAALAERAHEYPDAVALNLVSFSSGKIVVKPYTARRLYRAAQCAAAALCSLGVGTGDRVLLSITDAADFLACFVGAQCIGAIPVPLPSIQELPSASYATRVNAVIHDARPSAALVDDSGARTAILRAPSAPSNVQELRELVESDPPSRPPFGFDPNRHPTEIAFLQYTSGSTNLPKGVVVLHSNLVANLRAIAEGAQISADDVIFSWLPLFHDMGLISGLLLGTFFGVPTFVANSRWFVRKPDTWLRAVHSLRASFSAGPNFAFHIAAHRIPEERTRGLDLSSWRLAFNGSETVLPQTVEAFANRYSALGFRSGALLPAYGLAECALAVSFVRPGARPQIDWVDRAALMSEGIARPAARTAPGTTAYCSVGPPVPGHRVRIVNVESRVELGDRRLGEIVVAGPSVTPGYFRELERGAVPQQELRTGDLGYTADGELYVVDRIKDVLVVAGRKFTPSDIEQVVASTDGVRAGAVIAFSLPGDTGTEELHVAVGLTSRANQRKESVRLAIQERVAKQLNVAASVVFVPPSQLPRTSSGKLRRSACRDLLSVASRGQHDSH
jgi:acyl-CoA synthetase (AMP-forming)/AMP-acid ligase II